jgi:hypothetical protein
MSISKKEYNPKKVLTEPLTLQIPKNIMDLLRYVKEYNGMIPEKYVLLSLIERILSDIDSDALISNKGLIKKFDLSEVIKEYK